MFKLTIVKKAFASLVVASLLAGLVLAAIPTSSVAAAASTPTETPGQDEAQVQGIARLERLYRTEQNTLQRQVQWVDRTLEIIDRVNQLIEKFLSKGKNVEPLREALATFQTGVHNAKAQHDHAGEILATHAGFDEQGKVTDRAQARTTVETAGTALRGAALTYRAAFTELHLAIFNYIQANRPLKTTQPTQ
jgi:TolA-binding protein